jgi:hypothetical protein
MSKRAQRTCTAQRVPQWLTQTLTVRQGFDPVPDWLAWNVLAPILSDLNDPFAVDFEIGIKDGTLIIAERDEVGSVSWTIAEDAEPGGELLVECAESLQEYVFESRGAWAQARPTCPGHTHPASPRLFEGAAWWTCPRDARPLAPIGELHRRR